MEKWLQKALDKNYKTRGTDVVTAADGNQQTTLNPGANRILTFYTELDAILQTKILSVFCLNTAEFYFYDITPNMQMNELLEAIAKDTKALVNSIFFIYPTSHPKTQSPIPMDLYVEEWQDTNDKNNPPVMLYVVLGPQCDYNAPPVEISAILRKCTEVSNTPTLSTWLNHQWFIQKITQHAHFLIYSEQRRAKTLLIGIKEFALTVEEYLIYFDTNINDILDAILVFFGRMQQFITMINGTCHQSKTKKILSEEQFQKWYTKAKDIEKEMQDIMRIKMTIKNRYKSTERRIKLITASSLCDDKIDSDIFQLNKFCDYLKANAGQTSKMEFINQCSNFIYELLKVRSEFYKDKRIEKIRDETKDIFEEFLMIKKLVNDTEQLLIKSNNKIEQETLLFIGELTNFSNSASINILNAGMNSLTLDGVSGNSEMSSFDVSTLEMIQEAHRNIEMMEMEFNDENINSLPATIDFNFK